MNDCFMWNLSTKMIANRDVGIDYQKDLVVCKPHRHTFIEIAYTVSGRCSTHFEMVKNARSTVEIILL